MKMSDESGFLGDQDKKRPIALRKKHGNTAHFYTYPKHMMGHEAQRIWQELKNR